jgi:predicted aspartyl protease
MGMTKARVIVKGPREESDLELMVDTGSLYTWVSETLLKEIGISPTSLRKFTTIEGRHLERPIGEALIEYNGESAHCVVVFAQPSDVNVMGVTALENLGLEVDPTQERLKRSESLAAF